MNWIEFGVIVVFACIHLGIGYWIGYIDADSKHKNAQLESYMEEVREIFNKAMGKEDAEVA